MDNVFHPPSITEPCFICDLKKKDDILYGPFMEQGGIRCHYFCILFCLDLPTNGCDIKDMAGFRVDDIKTCMEQHKKRKWTCFYCGGPNPASVCHRKVCRKRFHVPCAMDNNALMKFYGGFESFCDIDAKKMIKRAELPAPDQLCDICFDTLGKYDPVGCFQPPCCIDNVKEKEKGKRYWMHYRCAMQGGRTLGYYFNCFAYSCGETSDEAKQGYLDCGIFLPKRDALYENGKHFKKLDKPIANEPYLETTYDNDATLFQKTFIPDVETEVDCDYANRCIGSKLGMADIVKCRMDGCELYVHVKCIRYYRDLKSNRESREEKFFCKKCTKNSCLALV